MERRDDYGRRGRGVRPTKVARPCFAVTRKVLRGLVGGPWRSFLSGVGIAMGLILSAKIFIAIVIVLLTTPMVVDICNFLDRQ